MCEHESPILETNALATPAATLLCAPIGGAQGVEIRVSSVASFAVTLVLGAPGAAPVASDYDDDEDEDYFYDDDEDDADDTDDDFDDEEETDDDDDDEDDEL